MPQEENLPAEPSDRSLLERLRRGSEDAATQLYLRYAGRVRALARASASPDLARRVDADDIVQSVFGSFFRGASGGYYDVPAGEELWKLLLVIALNKIRAKGAYHRAAKRDVRRTCGEEALADLPQAQTGDDAVAYALLRGVVEEALARLPPAPRQIIELRIEGHEVAPISERTGRSRRTVERVLQEFRRALAAALREEEPHDAEHRPPRPGDAG